MGYFIWGPKFPVFSSKRRKNSTKTGDLKASLLEREFGSKRGRDMAVPKGCLAVYVGENLRRFVIPTSYLCLPAFKALMEKVAEEFGFEQTGGLRIPCDEAYFEEILKVLEGSQSRNEEERKKKMKTKERIQKMEKSST